jgi:hypothetical protein
VRNDGSLFNRGAVLSKDDAFAIILSKGAVTDLRMSGIFEWKGKSAVEDRRAPDMGLCNRAGLDLLMERGVPLVITISVLSSEKDESCAIQTDLIWPLLR